MKWMSIFQRKKVEGRKLLSVREAYLKGYDGGYATGFDLGKREGYNEGKTAALEQFKRAASQALNKHGEK